MTEPSLPEVSANVAKKAREYLTSGKIQVISMDGDRATLTAQGSGQQPYEVRCDHGIWSCSCPAHTSDCAHTIACRLIIGILPNLDDISLGDGENADLAAIFDDLAIVPNKPDNDWT